MPMLHRYCPRHAPTLSTRQGFVYGLVLLLCAMLLPGCNAPGGREIERHMSPDKLVDVVVVEPETFATDAIATTIYLVAAGKEWKGESPILAGNRFEGLQVVWKRPHFLEVHYKKGRIFSFASFWNSRDVQNFKYEVELRLVPETDSTLPN
jgi:hypothetical protein